MNKISFSGTDISVGIQSPVEHEGSSSDRSLSTGTGNHRTSSARVKDQNFENPEL